MAQYRIYLLDSRGHFAKALVHEAESDEAALLAAAALEHPHGFEVWDHGRRVRPALTPISRSQPAARPMLGGALPDAI